MIQLPWLATLFIRLSGLMNRSNRSVRNVKKSQIRKFAPSGTQRGPTRTSTNDIAAFSLRDMKRSLRHMVFPIAFWLTEKFRFLLDRGAASAIYISPQKHLKRYCASAGVVSLP